MLPVMRELAAAGVLVSVDTTRAEVAAAALEAGARIVNDVSGGLADPEMAKVVAAAEVPWVLMHWRGHSRDMQALARYGDVVADVRAELSRAGGRGAGRGRRRRVGSCSTRGWASPRPPSTTGRCWPGWTSWSALGFPVLVGASRKSFLGRLLAGPDGQPARSSGASTRRWRPPCWPP